MGRISSGLIVFTRNLRLAIWSKYTVLWGAFRFGEMIGDLSRP